MSATYTYDQAVLIPGTPIFGCPECFDPWESEPTCEHYAAECDTPCCTACNGAGGGYDGPCSDCYGTGHTHPTESEAR